MRAVLGFILIGAICSGVALAGSGTGVFSDEQGDAVIRRTDSGNDAPLPPGYTPIDLLELRLEGWVPDAPQSDPYTGTVISGDADIVRIQVKLDGLVCPPGPLALDDSPFYEPYLFGDRPFFGYIEIDIDDQKNTGGELDLRLFKNRYLANVARFGLSPNGSISERIARVGSEVDDTFSTLPQIERSGGEFSLVMCGCFTPEIISQDGDSDSIFDAGESWIVNGRFFERFNAFLEESILFGGSDFGLFDPEVDVLFEHDTGSDITTVTLVFPISNAGAAQLSGGATQQIDFSLLNHTSIEEALDDLIEGAPFASGALGELVDGWEGRDFDDYRRPRDWNAHAIVGTAPTIEDPTALFVWTDTGFDEVLGDLNDDDLSDTSDTLALVTAIDERDGGPTDGDGMMNGEIEIIDFGTNFELLDINGDGLIAFNDILHPLCDADLTGDGELTFFDISAFLTAFAAMDPIADFTDDGQFNFFDVSAFLLAFSAGCPA